MVAALQAALALPLRVRMMSPQQKKAKGLEGPDSMRNLSWNQLQSMDAEEPGILSNLCSSGMLCAVFHWDIAVIFICLGSCWKKNTLKLRYCVELLPAEWKIGRTCCTSSETTLLQKEVQSPAFIENSSGLGYCILVIDKRSAGFFATWQCLILGLFCGMLSCLNFCKTWTTTS